MPRTPRIYQQAVCYHIYNRGVNRLPVLDTDQDKSRFIATMRKYKEACDAQVYHWAVMDNHYHMLVEVDFDNLRPFVGGIQQVYATMHHHTHGSVGIFWQGRFKSPPVQIGNALVRCGRYIERNPIRAGTVECAWDYRWSSAAHYVLGIDDGITDSNCYIGADTTTKRDRTIYGESLMSTKTDDWYKANANSEFIGSEDFLSHLKKERGRHRRRRGRPVKREE